jgi:tRNA A-37 threonylcarbamoyl transferase component Bud32
MSQVRSAHATPSARADDFDRLLDEFDLAWQRECPPAIEAFLPARLAGRKSLLHELIKIDLEYRWRGRRAGPAGALPARPRLEDYVARLPRLGALHRLPLDLIGEEYRVRQRWGDRPGCSEYAARFPRHGGALRAALTEIDAELRDEADGECAGAFTVQSLSTPPSRAAQPPSRRLGRYQLGDLLGTGAFGSVWQAWDAELGREVAVKLPRSGRFSSPVEEERFLREARSAAQLHHRGIVAVYDVGRAEDTLYIVSELVRGRSLTEWTRKDRPSFREAADLIAQIADALDYAHRQGVVHRDVKPSNILVGGSGEPGRATPRLMDFGLALRDVGEIAMTADGQVLGTPAYMSPEQVRNPHAVDGRSDVYSLGVILYELLTGELPFRGEARMLLAQAASEDPRPPRLLNDRIPRDLETICLKCLAKDPRRRYRTAGALAADLRCWLAGEPIRARPVGRLERLWLWAKRRRAVVAAGALAAVALVAVTGAPAAAILTAVAAASLLFALYKAKTAADLAGAVEDLKRTLQKTAATLQYALRQYSRARVERDRAATAEAQVRRRLIPARELARAVLYDLPDRVEDKAARALLIQTALAYLDGLAREADDDASLLRELAVAYGRVGDVQWGAAEEAARDSGGALASHRKSLEMFADLARVLPDNAQAQRDLEASRAKVADLERALALTPAESGGPAE